LGYGQLIVKKARNVCYNDLIANKEVLLWRSKKTGLFRGRHYVRHSWNNFYGLYLLKLRKAVERMLWENHP